MLFFTNRMKGVILAGGLGTRLYPLTKVTNKHLLPIYNRPMILYPLETLKQSGVREIMIVCGKQHAGHFMNLLGSGKEYGAKLSYALQDTDNGGIADALSYSEDFSDNESVAVILGDNIFTETFEKAIRTFDGGGMVFLKEVKDPERYGVVVLNKTKTEIITIEEKPKKPKSNYIQTGLYLFDSSVYSIVRKLKPSKRGELEIADVTGAYLKQNRLGFSFVRNGWYDAGTIDSLLGAGNEIARKERGKKD